MRLAVKKLNVDAKLPSKGRDTDEGYDVFSCEDLVIPQGQVRKVSLGVACWVETEGWDTDSNTCVVPSKSIRNDTYWLQVEGRSGLAMKGIFPVGGIVDCGYTGDIGIMLANMSAEAFTVSEGDKIAQLVIRKHYHAEIEEVQEVQATDRGDKGFGSSGVV